MKGWYSEETKQKAESSTFMGTPLKDLSKEELLCIISHLGKQLKTASEQIVSLSKSNCFTTKI